MPELAGLRNRPIHSRCDGPRCRRLRELGADAVKARGVAGGGGGAVGRGRAGGGDGREGLPAGPQVVAVLHGVGASVLARPGQGRHAGAGVVAEGDAFAVVIQRAGGLAGDGDVIAIERLESGDVIRDDTVLTGLEGQTAKGELVGEGIAVLEISAAQIDGCCADVLQLDEVHATHAGRVILKTELRSTKDTKSTKGEGLAENRGLTRWVSREEIVSPSFRVLSCLSWTLHPRI